MSKEPTTDQNDVFLTSVQPHLGDCLRDAMEWIEKNMEPDAVWHKAYIVEWVRMNQDDPDLVYGEEAINEHVKETRMPHEVFDNGELIASVNDNHNPADVFRDDELGCWAEDHDYVAKSNDPLDFMTLAELRAWTPGNAHPGQMFESSDLEEWAKKYRTPAELFSEEELSEWAIDHDFTKQVN